MCKFPAKIPAILISIFFAGLAMAGGRPIRVDFGDWSPAQAIGSAACPGTTAGSTIVIWKDYYLVGSEDTKYLADAYCQTALAGDFDRASFNGEDSPYISRLVGLNTDNRVKAIRYTFLDGNRFSTTKQGYQWVIYSFPGVELIGLNASAGFPLTADSRITYQNIGNSPFWSADQYPDGQYLCFVYGSGSGGFGGNYIISDNSYQFSAKDDLNPSNRNDCVARLTGVYANSFEDPQ